MKLKKAAVINGSLFSKTIIFQADYSDSLGVSSEVSVSAPFISGSVTDASSAEDVGSSTGGTGEVDAPLEAAFFAAFLGAAFFVTAFLGAAFLGAAFFGAAFLGAAFLGAAFLGAAFFGAAFFGAAFLGAAFLVAICFEFLRLEMLFKFTQAKCIPKLFSRNQVNN